MECSFPYPWDVMIILCITVQLLFTFVGNMEKETNIKINTKVMNPLMLKRGNIRCVTLMVKLTTCLYFRDCLFWRQRNRPSESFRSFQILALWFHNLRSRKNDNVVKSLRLYLIPYKETKTFHSIEIIPCTLWKHPYSVPSYEDWKLSNIVI